MIYEMRVYEAVPGRLPDIIKRFETKTLKIFERHGIKQAGFFTTLVGEHSQHLTYFLAWESLADREKRWGAFASDPEWLAAVAQHHEVPDGSGYPLRLREVSEVASLVRRADVYTAKLSSRSTRSALAANRAGREIFMQDPSDAVNNAIVKEFGIYPPGCCVRLASGELGIVVRRGSSANAPIVASLVDARGRTLAEPMRRDAASPGHQVAGTFLESDLHVRIAPEKLVLLACG